MYLLAHTRPLYVLSVGARGEVAGWALAPFSQPGAKKQIWGLSTPQEPFKDESPSP